VQHHTDPSPWVELSRRDWAALRSSTPMTLTEEDLEQLRGLNEAVSLDEVADIYLPLSRLLNLYVAATQELHRATDTFLGSLTAKVPFVIGLAGSVAVGKSTTSRILQALLSRWPDHPEVALIATDGFLLPNAELERRGLMDRKGFPESYDTRALVRFVARVKSGEPEVPAPTTSMMSLPMPRIMSRSPLPIPHRVYPSSTASIRWDGTGHLKSCSNIIPTVSRSLPTPDQRSALWWFAPTAAKTR
jgi:type I pantothenate kinase